MGIQTFLNRLCAFSAFMPLVFPFTRRAVRHIFQVMKTPCAYSLAGYRNGTLYTDVTSNLAQRMEQHSAETVEGFTKRYHVHKLVWHEAHTNMAEAIVREKASKKWRRVWKLQRIEELNPQWRDLAEEML